MPGVRVKVYIAIINNRARCAIHILNCNLNLPDKIYNRLQRYIDYQYFPDTNRSYLTISITNNKKYLRHSYNEHFKTIHSNTFPIPNWLYPYIINFTNYSENAFTRNLHVNVQTYHPANSIFSTTLFPKFRCFNRCFMNTTNSLMHYEYLCQGGVNVAVVEVPVKNHCVG